MTWELDEYVIHIVDEYFTPCGLRTSILAEIWDLRHEGIEVRAINMGLEWVISLAESLSSRMDRDICHYLHQAIKRKWLSKYIHRMREAFSDDENSI